MVFVCQKTRFNAFEPIALRNVLVIFDDKTIARQLAVLFRIEIGDSQQAYAITDVRQFTK